MIKLPNQNTLDQSISKASECHAIVDHSKSRRLREMFKGINACGQNQKAIWCNELENALDIPPDLLSDLRLARSTIDDGINKIMSSFPDGRKNSLFRIRFGHLDEIKAREIQAIFNLLKLDYKRVDLQRLKGLNYHGHRVF